MWLAHGQNGTSDLDFIVRVALSSFHASLILVSQHYDSAGHPPEPGSHWKGIYKGDFVYFSLSYY